MFTLLLTIAGIHLVALMSPGPDFFLVSQTAASSSRLTAFKVVLGISTGVFVWAGIALLGLHVLLQKMVWLRSIVMIAGGCYLSYLGYVLLKSSYLSSFKAPGAVLSRLSETGGQRMFLRGLLTNLANPKALVYFGSVFSMFVGAEMSSQARLWIFFLIVVETLLWFTFVATVFGLPVIRNGYQRLTQWVDGIAGILFTGFGLSLIYKGFIR